MAEFLESNSISVAYSNYGVCAIGTFLSAGKINISEYNVNLRVKSRKARSMSADNFVIITVGDSTVTYITFLEFFQRTLGHLIALIIYSYFSFGVF